MLNVRLRLAEDSGSANSSSKSRILEALDVTVTTALNTPSTLSFSVSRDTFVPTQFPFVVALDYATDGGTYRRTPQYNSYIIERESDDSKDPGKVATYEGTDFVSWLLQGGLLAWASSAKDGKRTWYEPGKKPASAGYTLHGMLTELKNSGWFPALSWDFNGTKDSANNNWVAGDKTVTAWELTKNMQEILTQMTDDGLCEWSTDTAKLNLYRMGTMGRDLPNVVLGGRGFTSVPVTVDATGLYSHVRAIPDDLPWQNYTSDTTIRNRFGHRSIVLTQSGIKDKASSQKNAQPYIEAGKEVQREEGYEWTPSPNTAHPWRDFSVGDQVTAHSRGGKQQRRVIGIIINQAGVEPAQVSVKVGDFIKTRAAKLKQKLDSIAVSGATSGSGSGFPQTPGPTKFAPVAPQGVLVTSNSAHWTQDGTAISSVTIQWAPTTEATDGSEVDVVEYEIWSRTMTDTLSLDLATQEPEAVITHWEPGVPRMFAVRGKSAQGVWSEWSTEMAVTPVVPLSIVPKAPTNLRTTSNVGSWTATTALSTVGLKWDNVVESLDGDPVEVARYEIEWSNGTTTAVDGNAASVQFTAGNSVTFRVRALSTLGVWGDYSGTLTVAGAYPTISTRTPTAPVLTTGGGGVFARWDGQYTGTGSGEYSITVETKVGTGSWIIEDSRTKAGQTSLRAGAIGDTVLVRFRAYDRLGRLTGTSPERSIVVEGIPMADLDQSVQDFLDGLQTDISEVSDAANAAQSAADNAQSTANTARTEATQKAAAAEAAAKAHAEAEAEAARLAAIATASGDASSKAAAAEAAAKAAAAADASAKANAAQAAAEAKAATAQSAANAAQSKADQAFNTATNAATAAGQAQTAADGKSKVWYSATVPPGTGHKVGDTWFQANAGNQIARWDGSSWVAERLGTSAIANLSITNALIADATIQNAKIANLDAAKITTGTLNAGRIGANSITAEKVLLAGSNMVPNPDLQVLTGWTSGTVTASLTSTTRGRGVLITRSSSSEERTFTSTEFYVSGDTVYTISATVLAQSASGATPLRIEVIPINTSGVEQAPVVIASSPADGVWRVIRGQYKVPATNIRSLRFQFVGGATTATTGNDYLVQPRAVEAAAAEMIVDGAVKARHVEMDEGFADKFWANEFNAHKIKVDFVEPNFGENLNLSANGDIILQSGRADELAGEVASLTTTVQGDDPAVPGGLVKSVADAANLAQTGVDDAKKADGKATTANTLAKQADAKATSLASRVVVTPTGLELQAVNGEHKLVQTPEGISVVQGVTTISSWIGSQFSADHIVVKESAQIGAHKATKSGTRTTWRPM